LAFLHASFSLFPGPVPVTRLTPGLFPIPCTLQVAVQLHLPPPPVYRPAKGVTPGSGRGSNCCMLKSRMASRVSDRQPMISKTRKDCNLSRLMPKADSEACRGKLFQPTGYRVKGVGPSHREISKYELPHHALQVSPYQLQSDQIRFCV
jgi:hypothetical protein